MQITKVVALRGPNIRARCPVLEVFVDVSGLSPSLDPAAYRRRIVQWLTAANEDGNSPATKLLDDAFTPPPGRPFAAGLLWATLKLQSLVDKPVHVGVIEATSNPAVWIIAAQFEEAELARACLNAARESCLRALYEDDCDLGPTLDPLRDLAKSLRLVRNTAPLVAAARARGIPVRRLNDESLVQLGHGVHQHRIKTPVTDRTGNIASAITKDKELTKRLLREIGVPVPEGRPVRDADDAWAAACEFGLPVVVKPRDADCGKGVATNLNSREEVSAAYTAARAEREDVLVERLIPGVLHRLFVVGDELVAALRLEPASVVGDGRQTVSQLVDELNRDPCRVYDFRKFEWEPEALDMLAEQGYTRNSVIPRNVRVRVWRFSYTSWAGTANIDVTDKVHPTVAARAIDATRIVGLDIAGLDVVVEDISRPLEEQRGAVIEVNDAPAMYLHLHPMVATPRPIPEKIIATLYPGTDDGRIPIALVTGGRGATSRARALARRLGGKRRGVALATEDGAFVDDLPIRPGDCANAAGARALFLHPRAAIAVLETPLATILHEGLAVDRCEVALVLGTPGGDAGALQGDLMRALRVVVETVSPTGTAVLDGDDPAVASLAPVCPGSVILFHRTAEGARPGGGSGSEDRSVPRADRVVLSQSDLEAELCLLAGRLLEEVR